MLAMILLVGENRATGIDEKADLQSDIVEGESRSGDGIFDVIEQTEVSNLNADSLCKVTVCVGA